MGLIRQSAGNGNPVADGDLTGPGLDAWLTLGVRLESVAAELEETNRRYRKLWASVHRIQLTGPEIPDVAGGLADRPDLLGPRRGWWWDVVRIAMSDGSGEDPPGICLWKNDPVKTNLVDVFDGEPFAHRWSSGQLLLGPDERLVYGWPRGVATGLGAGWTIVGEAIQVTEECLPLYLA